MALGAVVPIATTIIGGQFTPPTPRTFGFLPGTLVELQEGIEGKIANLNNRTYTDVQTVALMDEGRRGSTGNVAGFSGVWQDLLPTWSPTPAALAEIRRRDPSFVPRGGMGGAGSTGGTPDKTSGTVAPGQTPSGGETPPLTRAATAGGIIGTLPLWATLALAGGIGYLAYKAVLKK